MFASEFNATTERSFWTFRRIVDYLQNILAQVHLNSTEKTGGGGRLQFFEKKYYQCVYYQPPV